MKKKGAAKTAPFFMRLWPRAPEFPDEPDDEQHDQDDDDEHRPHAGLEDIADHLAAGKREGEQYQYQGEIQSYIFHSFRLKMKIRKF